MATLSDIYDRVRRRVIDLPAAVQAEVEILVEKAHRELQDRHNFIPMERRETRTTVVGSNSLGLLGATTGPLQFKEYHETDRPFWMDDNRQIHFLALTFDEAEARRVYLSGEDFPGEPKVVIHRHNATGGGFEDDEWLVLPYPDGLAQTSDGEYTVQIPYYRYEDFGNNNWVVERAHWYLTYKATAEAFALNWAPDHQGLWEQMAEREFRRLVSADKRARVSFADTLVPHSGPNAGKLRL